MKMQMISTLQKEIRVHEARQQRSYGDQTDGLDQHVKEFAKRMKEKVSA